MKHFISTTLVGTTFEKVEKQVADNLKTQGFGILTEIDVTGTFKKKLDIDFRKYKILGACNPQIAYKVLQIDNKAGVFLPCNIIIEECENGDLEVSAVNPVASMMSIENQEVDKLMAEVEKKLKIVIESLK